MSAYAFVPSYGWVMAMRPVWSQGLHLWMPLPSSMALALAEPDRAGRRLGQVSAAGALGSAAGLALAFALTLLGVKDPAAVSRGRRRGAGGRPDLPRHPPGHPHPEAEARVPARYFTYYLLNFLEGWRKQITVAFAGFLLVRVHGASLREMIVLWASIQAIGYVASPRVGRLMSTGSASTGAVLLLRAGHRDGAVLSVRAVEIPLVRGIHPRQRHLRAGHGDHLVPWAPRRPRGSARRRSAWEWRPTTWRR